MQKSVRVDVITTNNILYDPLSYSSKTRTYDAVFEVNSTCQKLLLNPSIFKELESAGHMLNIIGSCNEGINYDTGIKSSILGVGYVLPKINNMMNLFYPDLKVRLRNYTQLLLETYDGLQSNVPVDFDIKIKKLLQALMFKNLVFSYNDLNTSVSNPYTFTISNANVNTINYDELITPVTLSSDILKFNEKIKTLLSATGDPLISNSLIQQIVTFLTLEEYNAMVAYIIFLNKIGSNILFDFVEFFASCNRGLCLIINVVHTLNFHGTMSTLTKNAFTLAEPSLEMAINLQLPSPAPDNMIPKPISSNDITNSLDLSIIVKFNYLNFFENKAKGISLWGETTDNLFGDYYFIAEETESLTFDISDEVLDLITHNVDLFNQKRLNVIVLRKSKTYPIAIKFGANINYCFSQKYLTFTSALNTKRNNELISLAFEQIKTDPKYLIKPQKSNIEQLFVAMSKLAVLPLNVNTTLDRNPAYTC